MAYMSLTDAKNERYSPPEDLVAKKVAQQTMRLDMCGFKLFMNPFGFEFANTRNPDEKLINTQGSSFIMMDKYMQLDLNLPSQRIYGLGERTREFTLSEGTWTMWANGQETPYDDGTGGLQNYGVHPFALVQSARAGEYFGIYFRNSNAQSPVLKHNKDGSSTL
jgi:alpha-glucosidase (family GH31 glycosyl hydrolase)